jgi:hypothetical protein
MARKLENKIISISEDAAAILGISGPTDLTNCATTALLLAPIEHCRVAEDVGEFEPPPPIIFDC